MMPRAAPSPLVFALTPRLGDLNHRYLVSAVSPAHEPDVQSAYAARLHADDILAEIVTVPQKDGRRAGDEWLIVRDPRVRTLSPDRKAAILAHMRAWLEGLTPPPATEAATQSMCVPFSPIDAVAQRIDTELGIHSYPAASQKRPLLMPLALATCVLVLGTGFVLMNQQRDSTSPTPERHGSSRRGDSSMDQLIAQLATTPANEKDVVESLRKKVAPDLREGASLLDALNYLRPSIERAANDDYRSHSDAMKDEPMLTAIRATMGSTAVDAFLNDENQARLRKLDPDSFRSLAERVLAWPDMEIDNERPAYRDIDRSLREASRAAQPRRRGDAPRVTGVFVYEDAKERLPVLLGLFQSGDKGELTEFGQLLATNPTVRPSTLSDWLEAAARAYESAGAHAHPWLSREVLAMNRRQAVDPRNKTPGAAKFYEQLDALLSCCRATIRTKPSLAPAVTTEPQATPST